MSRKESPPETKEEVDQSLYLSQTDTVECRDFLIKNQHFVKGALAGRHPICTNRLTLGDWNIEDFSDDQLILYKDHIDDKVYCFTTSDILKLKKVNPYSKNDFSFSFLKTIEQLQQEHKTAIPVYPLEHALKLLGGDPEYCPQGALLTTPFIKYLMTDRRYTLELLRNHYRKISYYRGNYQDENLATIIPLPGIFDMYKTTHHGRVYVYRIRLRSDAILSNVIYTKDIAEMATIFDSTDRETSPVKETITKINDFSAYIFLYRYLNAKNPDPSGSGYTELLDLKIVTDKPVVVYRGLGWEYESDSKLLPGKTIGQKFYLNSRSLPMSWTTSICVAENFASYNRPYGMVVKTVLQPNDILIDTRLLDYTLKTSLYWAVQNEIISRAFDEVNKPKEFEVTVVKFVGTSRKSKPFSLFYPKDYNSLKNVLTSSRSPSSELMKKWFY